MKKLQMSAVLLLALSGVGTALFLTLNVWSDFHTKPLCHNWLLAVFFTVFFNGCFSGMAVGLVKVAGDELGGREND